MVSYHLLSNRGDRENNEDNVGKRSNIVDIIVLDYSPLNN